MSVSVICYLTCPAQEDDAALQAAVSSGGGVTWRLDQSIRDTTAQRQVEAISKLAKYADAESPSERLLRCILVGVRRSPLLAQQPPLWVADEAWRADARTQLKELEGLNSSQRRAVAKAMVSSLTLWQGPPGTGKTRTLLALMQVMVGTSSVSARRWSGMGTLLACADTNAAVDNLVEGLVARGIAVVRVGSPAKVRPHLRHLTLEAMAEATTQGARAAKARDAARAQLEALRDARARLAAGGGGGGDSPEAERLASAERRCRSAVKEADAAVRDAQAEVLDRAQVRGDASSCRRR
jgi:hypothetical protein